METHASRSRLSARQAEVVVAMADLVTIAACLIGLRTLPHAFGWVDGGAAPQLAIMIWSLAGPGFAIILMVALHRLGHYERRRSSWQQTGDLIVCGLLLAALDLKLALVGAIDLPLPVLGWSAVIVLVPLIRARLRRRLDLLGLWRRPTVVVGTGENAVQVAGALLREPSLGLSVVAFADLGARKTGGRRRSAGARPRTVLVGTDSIPVIPAATLVGEPEQSHGAAHLVVAPDALEMPACLELFERLAAHGCDVDFVPPLGGLTVAHAGRARFVGANVASIRLRDPLSAPLSQFYKRALDLILGSSLLVFTAPLLCLLAVAVMVVDGRPVLFWHQRVGMNGRPFACLKFRTMVSDAAARLDALLERDPVARAEWERDRKLRHDPRISWLGAWLRRTSLDELPQLWNVVRGDMSLVGPRPVVEDELQRYGPHAALYLKTRPGLSGLWQVSGRNEVDYGQRVRLDCHYVRNWTLLWDLALLLATVRTVLSRRGAY